ncbi:metabotropic glutamate receptor 4-like [Lycorma delicatula]|uniref:metabotropic glutamate receptor 4-like n=1 Tax=Lycorma delicatula TaxID=130591 RepID=UPI003F50F600
MKFPSDSKSEGNPSRFYTFGGVPQGSVLGPLFWLMLFDDVLRLLMPECSETTAYAIDLVVLVGGKNKDESQERGNAALASINAWMEDHDLHLAADNVFITLSGFIAHNNEYHNMEFQCKDGTAPRYKEGSFDQVVAIIGGQSSAVTIQVASMMRLFDIPIISYMATSPALSDEERFPSFFRTVPSDNIQAHAMLELLKKFNWTYVSIVHSDTEYGTYGYDKLKQHAPDYGICFATPLRVRSDEDYEKAINSLANNSDSRVVVVFAEQPTVVLRLAEIARNQGLGDRYAWVGSHGWSVAFSHKLSSRSIRDNSAGTAVEIANQEVLEGALAMQPLAAELRGFDDYFTSLKLSTHQHINPWFKEYWEAFFHCKHADKFDNDTRKFKGNICDETLKIDINAGYKQHTVLHFVRDAVYSVAQALHNMRKDYCPNVTGLCYRMKHIDGNMLKKYISDVNFNVNSSEPPIQRKIQEILKRYRSTPLSSGKSPSELYLKRRLHIKLDLLPLPPPCTSSPFKISQSAGDQVQARWYLSAGKPMWRLRTVVQKLGKLYFIVKHDGDGYSLKSHIDQFIFVSIDSKPKKTVTFASSLSIYNEPRRGPPEELHLEPPEAMWEPQEQSRAQQQPILRRSERECRRPTRLCHDRGNPFRFLNGRDGPPRYSILNLQRTQNNTFQWMIVGNYTLNEHQEPVIHIDHNILKYKNGKDFPKSSCNQECEPDQIKVREYEDTCCWSCEYCAEFEIRKDDFHCVLCPRGYKATPNKTTCEAVPEEYISYNNPWAIAALTVASFGIVATISVSYIFWSNSDTPVIKASGRELSYLLLLGNFIITFVM